MAAAFSPFLYCQRGLQRNTKRLESDGHKARLCVAPLPGGPLHPGRRRSRARPHSRRSTLITVRGRRRSPCRDGAPAEQPLNGDGRSRVTAPHCGKDSRSYYGAKKKTHKKPSVTHHAFFKLTTKETILKFKLYYATQCCVTLYDTTLPHTTLHSPKLYSTLICYTGLYCAILCYTMLYYITYQCRSSFSTLLDGNSTCPGRGGSSQTCHIKIRH